MTFKIFKETLEVTDIQRLKVPTGSKFLSVQVQYNVPQIWYLCNPENEFESRIIRIHGTGHPIKDNDVDKLQFIDTFQMLAGSLVFHVFEIEEEIKKDES